MTLFDAAERFASLDRSQVLLIATRCLHTQDKFSACALCDEVCPVHAITPGKPPTLDAAACQSCLACLPACPTGAFQADDDVQSLLSCVTHVEGKTVELLCGLHPVPSSGADPERIGLRVKGCLAGLGTGAYLALAALGLETILLRTDACSQCAWHSLGARVHEQAGRANDFLAAWEKPAAIICQDQVENPVQRILWEAKNPPLSRRDLFRMLGRQGQAALARTLEQSPAHPGQRLGRDRLRLLAATAHLPERSHFPEPGAPADIAVGQLGFATLSVSDACTACGVCAQVCPPGALILDKNEDQTSYVLKFHPQHCIDCEVCIHVCAPAAISINQAPAFEEVFGEKVVTLQAGELVKCEHCGARIAKREGVRLCPLCAYRRANPFGSAYPPGIAGYAPRPPKNKA